MDMISISEILLSERFLGVELLKFLMGLHQHNAIGPIAPVVWDGEELAKLPS